jgi:hypothetical protein
MARKPRKRCNGVGESITLKFDKSDPQEAAALAMSKLLAAKHGRRKDMIVALLSTLYEVYQQTGELPTSVTARNALSANYRQLMGFTTAVSRQAAGRGGIMLNGGLPGGMPSDLAMMELPRGNMFDDGEKPLIQVMDAAPQRASATEVAHNHALEMGNLFDDD